MCVYIYDGFAVQAAAPKPKPKVEDGIFGTSGGIGFTKENELFVGRVAMLGFAVSIVKSTASAYGVCSCTPEGITPSLRNYKSLTTRPSKYNFNHLKIKINS
jgi:hypothetical protein